MTTQHHPNRAVPFSHIFFKSLCCTYHMSSANQYECQICGKAFPTDIQVSVHAWQCGAGKSRKGSRACRRACRSATHYSNQNWPRKVAKRRSTQNADMTLAPVQFPTPKKGQGDTASRAIKSKGQVVTVYRAVRSRSNSAAHRIRHLFPWP